MSFWGTRERFGMQKAEKEWLTGGMVSLKHRRRLKVSPLFSSFPG